MKDKRFKQREMQVLIELRNKSHPNIITLLDDFVGTDLWGDTLAYFVMLRMEVG